MCEFMPLVNTTSSTCVQCIFHFHVFYQKHKEPQHITYLTVVFHNRFIQLDHIFYLHIDKSAQLNNRRKQLEKLKVLKVKAEVIRESRHKI